jgi:hypothetical protein
MKKLVGNFIQPIAREVVQVLEVGRPGVELFESFVELAVVEVREPVKMRIAIDEWPEEVIVEEQ